MNGLRRIAGLHLDHLGSELPRPTTVTPYRVDPQVHSNNPAMISISTGTSPSKLQNVDRRKRLALFGRTALAMRQRFFLFVLMEISQWNLESSPFFQREL